MKKQIFPVLVLILIISFSFSGCITVTIPNIPGLSPNTPSNPPSNADLPAESDQTGTAPAVSSFNSYPSSINYGASSTLSWEVSGASTISIDQGIGQVDVAGTRMVSPTASTVYTISATNAAGTVTRSSVTTVNSVPVPIPFSVTSITATTDPSTIAAQRR